MKQLISLFALLVGMILLVAWLSKPGNTDLIRNKIYPSQSPASTKSVSQVEMKIGKTTFNVEIAKTESERRVGLSEHEKLEKGSGMLFVFERKDFRPNFWMKGMKIPVDIIWINDNKVTQITKKLPVPSLTQADSDLPRYQPEKPVDYVLEINSGEAESYEVNIGDKVTLPESVN